MKKSDIVAYTSTFISYLLERLQYPLDSIILYGSAARGELEDGDIDLFLNVAKNNVTIKKECAHIQKKFNQSAASKRWKEKGLNFPFHLQIGILSEWELHRSIISDGIVLYGKYLPPIHGKGYALVHFLPISSIATRNYVVRALFGRTETEIKKEGLVSSLGGKKIAPTVFVIPLENTDEILSILKQEKIDYSLMEFWSDDV